MMSPMTTRVTPRYHQAYMILIAYHILVTLYGNHAGSNEAILALKAHQVNLAHLSSLRVRCPPRTQWWSPPMDLAGGGDEDHDEFPFPLFLILQRFLPRRVMMHLHGSHHRLPGTA